MVAPAAVGMPAAPQLPVPLLDQGEIEPIRGRGTQTETAEGVSVEPGAGAGDGRQLDVEPHGVVQAGAQVGRQLEPERSPAEAPVAQDAEGADAVDAADELREVLVAPPAVRPDSPHQVADRQVNLGQEAAAGGRGRPRQGLDEQAQLDGDAAALGHVVAAEPIEDLRISDIGGNPKALVPGSSTTVAVDTACSGRG